MLTADSEHAVGSRVYTWKYLANILDGSDDGNFVSDVAPPNVDQDSLLQRGGGNGDRTRVHCTIKHCSGSATFALQLSRMLPFRRPRVSDVLGSTLQM